MPANGSSGLTPKLAALPASGCSTPPCTACANYTRTLSAARKRPKNGPQKGCRQPHRAASRLILHFPHPSITPLLYTFNLRSGLSFHDGQPVTTKDVIASLRRMLVRDTQNQLLAGLVTSMDPIDERSFKLKLREPFNYTEFLLGGSNGVAGVIMREQDALTDPFTPVKSRVGSGPFRFVEEEYRPGNKLVYAKFEGYRPRPEPASGFAGGKTVKLDRVEWNVIPDPAVAYAALRNGEVDFLDGPSLDLLPTVVNDPDVVVGEVWPIETYAVLRFNHLRSYSVSC